MNKRDEFESLMDEVVHKISEVSYLMGLQKARQHIEGNKLPLDARNRLINAVSEILNLLADDDRDQYVYWAMDQLTQAIIQLEDARGCIGQEMDHTGRTELLEEAEGRVVRARDDIVKVQCSHARMFSVRFDKPV